MENKTEWYKKLLRKLNKIKSGELNMDEYIHEVEAKIEAESKALSMSGVVGRSEQLPPNQMTDKEHEGLMKALYPKDNSKRFRR